VPFEGPVKVDAAGWSLASFRDWVRQNATALERTGVGARHGYVHATTRNTPERGSYSCFAGILAGAIGNCISQYLGRVFIFWYRRAIGIAAVSDWDRLSGAFAA
jgi:hypothetical protein